MSKSRTTLTLSLLCFGLLAVAAFAAPATARPGPGEQADDRPDRPDRRAAMENRTADGNYTGHHAERENRSAQRMDRHEHMRAAHDAWQACKRENSTANESVQVRCGDEKSFFLNATKARREGRALIGAIEALERRLGRLEAREIALEQKLESGNLTDNETAAIQEKIEKIDSHQERMAERLQDLTERLEHRQAKWQAVRDEVADHRHGHDDADESKEDGDDADSSESESESEDPSEDAESSESESDSQTSASA
ncbi:MAG TPA: hypothetical protein VM327_06285 [Candidatus Thermoplasmatota archaeon]|nr:hypothetical protein [Candidatus Thermoplasmatota archaeon]